VTQRFIRFRVGALDSEMLADVVADTDATAPETIRVDEGIATVGYRGKAPPCVDQLDAVGALVRGPTYRTWSLSEVLDALPHDEDLL